MQLVAFNIKLWNQINFIRVKDECANKSYWVLWSLTCNQITTHEYFGQFIIVFIFAEPNWVVLRIEVLPEVRDRLFNVFVGVFSFEVIHHKRAEGQEVMQ